MARIEKHTANIVIHKMQHLTREHPRPSKNIDIDPSRSHLNYSLTPPDRGVTAREAKDYFNQRMSEVYHYKRNDVKVACQWVVTAPKDLRPEDEKAFFQETYNYLNHLYGEENCLLAMVHYDEGVKKADGGIIGKPHMHYMFIPVIENKKYMLPNKKGNITEMSRYKQKVCANEVITKRHLINFHPQYQQWLTDHKIKCTVHSGVTEGKGRTVEELKLETKEIEFQKALDRVRELEAKVVSMEREQTINQEREVEWDEIEL